MKTQKTQTALKTAAAADLAAVSNAEYLEDLKRLLANAKRINTQKAYAADLAQFEDFLQNPGTADKIKFVAESAKIDFNLSSLVVFAESLQTSYKVSSIKRKVYAVKQYINLDHTAQQYIKATLAAIENAGTASTSTKQAKELNYNLVLSTVLNKKDSAKAIDKRNAFLLFLAFVSGFRGCEVVTLRAENVTFETVNGVEVLNVKALKTDTKQHTDQTRTFSTSNFNGKLLKDLYLAYIQEKTQHADANKDFLFCGCQYGKYTAAPLSRVDFCRLVKKVFGAEYSAHSTRRGLVAFASDNNFNDSQIANFMGYKNTEMIKRYNKRKENFDNSLFK